MWSQLAWHPPQYLGKMISGCMLFWSSLTLLFPVAANFAGAFFVIITSNWWTRQEQAFRAAFWLAGTPIGNLMGCLSSFAVGEIHNAIATWKLFFLLFSSLSFGFSIPLASLLLDNQLNSRWLNDLEKQTAVATVRQNQIVTAADHWKWPQFWEALRDPQTWFFFATAVGNTMPSTFASMFSSQTVERFGFMTLQATVISTCPAAVIQLETFLIFSCIASHYRNLRLFLSVINSIPPLIGASLLYALPEDNAAGRLAGYYLTYTHAMSFTLTTGLMSANYAGNTKKRTASGLIFVGWAAGIIAGPQFFLADQAPAYELAFGMLMGCYALMILVPICQFVWYRYENGRRDRIEAYVGRSVGLDFTDETDFEQEETFRYVM
ncbi:major facilitator superfamily domain-containing protein [Talaromyces proteolyticus]|uniref:Major facilitator superfamily domain-containing protein n=1 Tax=Talaromyces proteolyticus TaxID=1131652 RepID=A0AAD4KJ04_9EURO|nr:major facilitator superfamily domain-containing protein [Talaromyces proteolyticus]KAH8693645.1 major facilitator superfamily domain-containing protein [Talaromyces proteolyticus]